ncbi:MAG: DUF6266 family protein [bacterium]|nr:DUF6266 family protein [bacterium]
MAKVTSPLFSFDARGQIGKALVYAVWKGINYVRRYVVPQNPNTVDQQTIRSYFTTAVNAYQAENATTKSAWETYAGNLSRPQSGFNAYVGKYILYMIDHAGVEPTSPFMPPA